MDAQYSSLLGITQQEMKTCFKEHIDLFAKSEGMSKSERKFICSGLNLQIEMWVSGWLRRYKQWDQADNQKKMEA